jgi:hypothetical protein
MEDRSAPATISFRQLQAYLQTAPAEISRSGAASQPLPAGLDAVLEDWSRSSQELLQLLQQSGPAADVRRGPRQLMALGALQAHVRMGLQALAQVRRPQD